VSLFDLLRQEYIKGTVVDKYRLENGNVGLVVEQAGTRNRYHIQFKDDRRGPCVENLYGLLKEPFSGKTGSVDRLISPGDSVELTTSYTRGPFREAYRIHSVYGPGERKNAIERANPSHTPQYLIDFPYR